MLRRLGFAFFVLAFAIVQGRAQSAPSTAQTPEPGHPNPALSLAMGQWRFVTIGTSQVMTMGRQQPYLKFEERTHTITGFTGCNRLRGAYRADDSTLTFEKVATTRMTCAKDTYEQQVMDVLNSAKGYKIVGQELHVLGPKGTLAVLTRPHEEQTAQQKPSQK
jgi:heat shock protein HslJ